VQPKCFTACSFLPVIISKGAPEVFLHQNSWKWPYDLYGVGVTKPQTKITKKNKTKNNRTKQKAILVHLANTTTSMSTKFVKNKVFLLNYYKAEILISLHEVYIAILNNATIKVSSVILVA
jgi:hypothetical protein